MKSSNHNFSLFFYETQCFRFYFGIQFQHGEFFKMQNLVKVITYLEMMRIQVLQLIDQWESCTIAMVFAVGVFYSPSPLGRCVLEKHSHICGVGKTLTNSVTMFNFDTPRIFMDLCCTTAWLLPVKYICTNLWVSFWSLKKKSNDNTAITFYKLLKIRYLLHSSSSSSCTVTTDIPDPFSQHLPIVHRFRQVHRATPRILTELLYVGSSWSLCFGSAM